MNKAYIVANEQQEHEVLRKLEKKGNEWNDKRNATDFIPSEKLYVKFPYAIMSDRFIGWLSIDDVIVENYEIVYDGRKEEQMSEKYVVSQEFMNELKEWKEDYITDALEEKYHYVSAGDLDTWPGTIKDWWIGLNKPSEKNNRLIAIIRWVNGEDVFDVDKPKKWVVRSKECTEQGRYLYVYSIGRNGIKDVMTGWTKNTATHFDTKEEAESWANSHQEIIEVNND